MLMLNYTPNNSVLGRHIGGGGIVNPVNRFSVSVMQNYHSRIEDDVNSMKVQAFPTGTEPPYSYSIPMKGGELSSSTYLSGSSSVTSAFSLGKTMTANLSGEGSVSSTMSITSSLVATIAGTGELTAPMIATLGLAATLAGSGDISGSLSLLIPLVASLEGVGGITSNLKGNLDISAEIYVNESQATVNQLVAGVWSAIASDYNESGTMGNKLNGAGSAGDPWTTDLSTYTTDGTAGKILQDAKKKAALAASLSA